MTKVHTHRSSKNFKRTKLIVIGMGFEDLKPIFGQPKAECSDPQFLFHVRALNPTSLRFLVTDFHTSTWESIQSLQQLEDMVIELLISPSFSLFLYFGSELIQG